MKEKVRKSSLEYAFLFLVSIFIFHTDVLAYEMELGQRTEDETEEDIAHFDVHVSKVWTSKGKELLSYDVSESGKILISFPDRKVGVFDENMVFLFELSFHSSGSYGAIWNGENILLVDVRYPAAVECGMVGNLLFVVFTERGENIRLISARLATESERRLYYDQNFYN